MEIKSAKRGTIESVVIGILCAAGIAFFTLAPWLFDEAELLWKR